MSAPEKSRDVVILPAVALPEDPKAAQIRIDEIRADQRLAVEEKIVETSPLQVMLGLKMIRREVAITGIAISQKISGQSGSTLSTFLTIAALKEGVKAGKVAFTNVSFDDNQKYLSHKCITIMTKEGYKFTVFNLPNDVLGVQVEEDQAGLFL